MPVQSSPSMLPMSQVRKDVSLLVKDHPPVAFSDEDWKWFVDLAGSLGVPVGDERETLERLYGHLLGVNVWLNLTRLTEPRDYLKQHILDSLTPIAAGLFEDLGQGDTILDLGSGGGYPALPLMTWLPAPRYVLVDSRNRKVKFLAEACTIPPGVSAEARAFRGREARKAAPDLAGKIAAVVTRATGAPLDLALETRDLVHVDGRLMVYQGPAFDDRAEIDLEKACRKGPWSYEGALRFDLEEGDPQRALVLLRREKGRH